MYAITARQVSTRGGPLWSRCCTVASGRLAGATPLAEANHGVARARHAMLRAAAFTEEDRRSAAAAAEIAASALAEAVNKMAASAQSGADGPAAILRAGSDVALSLATAAAAAAPHETALTADDAKAFVLDRRRLLDSILSAAAAEDATTDAAAFNDAPRAVAALYCAAMDVAAAVTADSEGAAVALDFLADAMRWLNHPTIERHKQQIAAARLQLLTAALRVCAQADAPIDLFDEINAEASVIASASGGAAAEAAFQAALLYCAKKRDMHRAVAAWQALIRARNGQAPAVGDAALVARAARSSIRSRTDAGLGRALVKLVKREAAAAADGDAAREASGPTRNESPRGVKGLASQWAEASWGEMVAMSNLFDGATAAALLRWKAERAAQSQTSALPKPSVWLDILFTLTYEDRVDEAEALFRSLYAAAAAGAAHPTASGDPLQLLMSSSSAGAAATTFSQTTLDGLWQPEHADRAVLTMMRMYARHVPTPDFDSCLGIFETYVSPASPAAARLQQRPRAEHYHLLLRAADSHDAATCVWMDAYANGVALDAAAYGSLYAKEADAAPGDRAGADSGVTIRRLRQSLWNLYEDTTALDGTMPGIPQEK